MAITMTATPSSGVATKTAFRIDVSGVTSLGTFDANATPRQPEIKYYFEFSEGGTIKGTSYRWVPDASTGKHSWQNIILPDAGTYTISLKKHSDDTTVSSISVVVS